MKLDQRTKLFLKAASVMALNVGISLVTSNSAQASYAQIRALELQQDHGVPATQAKFIAGVHNNDLTQIATRRQIVAQAEDKTPGASEKVIKTLLATKVSENDAVEIYKALAPAATIKDYTKELKSRAGVTQPGGNDDEQILKTVAPNLKGAELAAEGQDLLENLPVVKAHAEATNEMNIRAISVFLSAGIPAADIDAAKIGAWTGADAATRPAVVVLAKLGLDIADADNIAAAKAMLAGNVKNITAPSIAGYNGIANAAEKVLALKIAAATGLPINNANLYAGNALAGIDDVEFEDLTAELINKYNVAAGIGTEGEVLDAVEAFILGGIKAAFIDEAMIDAWIGNIGDAVAQAKDVTDAKADQDLLAPKIAGINTNYVNFEAIDAWKAAAAGDKDDIIDAVKAFANANIVPTRDQINTLAANPADKDAFIAVVKLGSKIDQAHLPDNVAAYKALVHEGIRVTPGALTAYKVAAGAADKAAVVDAAKRLQAEKLTARRTRINALFAAADDAAKDAVIAGIKAGNL